MKKIHRGDYSIGDVVAVETIGRQILMGSVCERRSSGGLGFGPQFKLEPLDREIEREYWFDAEAVWSLEEIREREAYLEELRELHKLYPLGTINELIKNEIADVERISPPVGMAEALEEVKA